jgi:hypothetical protein
MKFLDSLEETGTVPAPKPVQKKATPAPKAAPAPVRAPVVESVESEDEYLSENGWKARGEKWVDPITRNIIIWEAAYAVQQERDRVGTLVESAPAFARTPAPVMSAPRQPMPKAALPKNKIADVDFASALLDGTEYDPDEAYQVAETMSFGQPPMPHVGDVGMVAEPMNYEMSEEDRMIAEAEREYISQGGSGSGDAYRTMNDGMGIAAMASGMLD